MENHQESRTSSLGALALRHPVLSYVLICFTITWSVWFLTPLLTGDDWTLMKIITGVGFGPSLAAIALDRLRGTGARIGTRRWWTLFAGVFVVVGAIDLSSLVTGDGISAAAFAVAKAPGLSPLGVVGSLAAAAVAGFIVASVACSRSRRLASLVSWRLSPLWWAAALFLPAFWMLGGVGVTWLSGGTIESVTGGLPPLTWALYVLRSTVFTLLVVAAGEEPGWRGWMLPELQKRFSPLLSSAILGVVWGFWHLPLFFNGLYPGSEPVLVFAKAGGCVLLAILFTWLYNRSGGALLLAVVLHTALNNTPRLLPPTDAMGLFMLPILATMVIVDRMWRKRTASPELNRATTP